jgi:cyanophycinase-like exopeptidase
MVHIRSDTMRQLFLFGGSLGAQFGPTSRSFLAAAGGKAGRIALLFMSGAPGWERFFPLYRDPWAAEGVGEVVPILPEPDGTLSSASLAELERATGIFMCGGDTRVYNGSTPRGRLGK